MALEKYRKKRDFRVSPEPQGKTTLPKRSALLYVIQKHRASHLHYDFRLAFNGVLLSWAIPKGPSLGPTVKRLAMQVEDHPLEYADFEGVIPQGQYGGGTVMVWDKGTWAPDEPDVSHDLRQGSLKFTLHGKKLRGSWALVRTKSYGGSRKNGWLLIKHRDKFASKKEITADRPYSALTRRSLAEIARDAGVDVEKAASGDSSS